MTGPAIAPTPSDVTPDWMTAVLRQAGRLGDGRVTDIAAKGVGHGQVGDSIRFTLTYAGPADGAPATLVGKFAAADPTSKATGATLQLYLREVAFYRDVAASVAINTPRILFAQFDPATNDFTLLMEDQAPARPGDQLAGCSAADAAVVMDQAAALHGPRWGDPTLGSLPWLQPNEQVRAMIRQVFPTVQAGFRARYADLLEEEFQVVGDALAAGVNAYMDHVAGAITVTHGDFRLDNMLFDVQGGAQPLATLDWQTVALGPGASDVAYFLGAGLPTELRRAHEVELLRRWHEGLKRHGVRDYDWDQCWRDYRLYAFSGTFTAVFASMNVERTPRGDAMFMTMARRHAQQILDHDGIGLLKSLG
ncbi:phosphotransferase family protein [Zavarzinia sp. CC-PAN008]|uniref:phosphotransferase family protein n=1 Tax=Zavarzinia sp. CC-PAN008 TaxID=3243332 RepID=UPI003F7433E6